jgi:hypothetical protein
MGCKKEEKEEEGGVRERKGLERGKGGGVEREGKGVVKIRKWR